MVYYRIRNWEKYQHYKADNKNFNAEHRPWIKLYRNIINSAQWASVSDSMKSAMIAMLCLADSSGFVTTSAELCQSLAHLRRKPNYKLFLKIGFIEKADPNAQNCPRKILGNSYAEKRREEKNNTNKDKTSLNSSEMEEILSAMKRNKDKKVF